MLCMREPLPAAHYTLHPQKSAQPHYFIKIGAYKIAANAEATVAKADMPLQIIRMRDYYSVVSPPYTTLAHARTQLQSVRQAYPDAYIVTLYRHTSAPQIPEDDTQTTRMRQGIDAFDAKRYEEALATFDRLLIETPENRRAQLYYARSLYALQLFTEAREAFRKLSKTDLSRGDAHVVAKYLDAIEKGRKKHTFSVTLSAGIGYDDNINLNPDRNTTRYGPYTLINDTTKTASRYGILACTLADSYKAEHFTLYTRLYSYNELLHSAKGNDLNFLDLSTTLIREDGRRTLLLPVGINGVYLGGRYISRNLYTAPALHYRLSPLWQARLHATLQDNHTAFARYRDYTLYGSGIGLHYAASRFYAGADIRWQHYAAKSRKRYDVDQNVMRYRLYGRFDYRRYLYLAADLGLERHRYGDLDPVMGYHRHDDKKRLSLTLGKTVTKRSLLESTYTYTDNDANINTFAYKKNNFTLLYRYQY